MSTSTVHMQGNVSQVLIFFYTAISLTIEISQYQYMHGMWVVCLLNDKISMKSITACRETTT